MPYSIWASFAARSLSVDSARSRTLRRRICSMRPAHLGRRLSVGEGNQRRHRPATVFRALEHLERTPEQPLGFGEMHRRAWVCEGLLQRHVAVIKFPANNSCAPELDYSQLALGDRDAVLVADARGQRACIRERLRRRVKVDSVAWRRLKRFAERTPEQRLTQ